MSLAISLLMFVGAPARGDTPAGAAASGTRSVTPTSTTAAAEPPRYALVIGHSRYTEVSVLPNVANDLEDMCATLKRLRFQATCLRDLPNRRAFMTAVESFAASIPSGASALLYYGGHAMQVAGENYLIPTGVSAADPRGWLPQFVRLSELFQASDRAQASFQFIVLDACRDDPEAARTAPAPATLAAQTPRPSTGQETLRRMLRTVRGENKFATYGIAAVRDAPRNTLVLFATGAGTSAFDGDGERNGPLTKHLLLQMQRTQLNIDQVVKNIIQAVGDETERRFQERQSPSLYGTFAGEFCFDSCPQVVSVQQLEDERKRAAQAQAERDRIEREKREREKREEQEREKREEQEHVVVPAM